MDIKFKLRLLLFIFFLLFLAILIKLFYIQVVSPKDYRLTSYLRTQKITPQRGRLFDRHNQPLVLNQPSFLVFAQPKLIKDKKETAKKLDSVLKIGEATVEARLNKDKVWVAIKSGLTKKKKDKIEKMGLKGIGFEDGFKRYYSEASLAAHLIGFVGKNKTGDDVGYFGLEGYYNKDLSGLPGLLKTERDILGRPIFIGTQEKIEPENGRDLILTVDKTVQEIAKRNLLKGLNRYRASSGCIIVAHPDTMQILALVCLPDFDPDRYYRFSEKFFKNPAISNLYEPGSIFKPLIMAAAIEEKAVEPDDFYNESGPIKIGQYTIHTWDDKYEGKITMTRIIEKSSNVGMVYVGQRLGREKLLKYLNRYGFGQKTGIDLQGEVAGVLKDKSRWYPIDYATVTFGQGIAVTPIQMIKAFSAVINGGFLLKPYVVWKIVGGKRTVKIKPQVVDRVISSRTSKILKKMLVSAVENGLVDWQKPEGYLIGGKTGTAQIPIKGRYDPSKTIASFIGFAPASKPRFIALVILREPATSPWGSETAAPIFFDLAKELLVYYNISPSQP